LFVSSSRVLPVPWIYDHIHSFLKGFSKKKKLFPNISYHHLYIFPLLPLVNPSHGRRRKSIPPSFLCILCIFSLFARADDDGSAGPVSDSQAEGW
jgi:hypothetical protein